jgi:hypothetical protein
VAFPDQTNTQFDDCRTRVPALLRATLRQIKSNAELVLKSQPGQERACLEEICAIVGLILWGTEDDS